jgi:hypothetical protein
MESKGLTNHLNGKIDGTRMMRDDGSNVGVEKSTNII